MTGFRVRCFFVVFTATDHGHEQRYLIGETMIKAIIKLVLGISLGIILLYLFIYFGGADYLEAFGKKTEQAGKELKQYEKNVKDATTTVEKSLEKAKDKVKEKIP